MRIRNRKTYFTTLPEGSAPEKTSKKISTILYFCFLFAIALYILFYVGFKFIYIERKGVVEVGRHLISSKVEGTIEEVRVLMGDTVDRSQLLIKIRPSFIQATSFTNRLTDSQNRLTDNSYREISPAASEKIMKLDNEIRLTTIELRTARENYRLLKAQAGQLIDEAFRDKLLELDTRPKRQTGLENSINKAALKIKALKAVKQSLQKYRADILKSTGNGFQPGPGKTGTPVRAGYGGVITSPVKGVVQTVFKEAGAQVFPGDALLALRQVNGKTAIHGFFKPEQVASVQKGKKVKIIFPDTSESTGIIGGHYAIAESYSKKLLDDYIPVRSEILVEIFPADTSDEEKWLHYDRMTVELRIRR